MSTSVDDILIRVRIDDIKAKNGIHSDAELARIADIDPRTICEIRNGRQKTFGQKDKKKLHKAFGLTPNDIEEFVSI